LESAFRATLDEYGVEALTLSQFITLVEKLMAASGGNKGMSEEEKLAKRNDIADAFIDADIDGK
jgi:hypothetical protein